jgi:hypothetical protein
MSSTDKSRLDNIYSPIRCPVELGNRSPNMIPSGSDLNDYTTPGSYASSDSSNVISNMPDGLTKGAFTLTVLDSNGLYSTKLKTNSYEYRIQILRLFNKLYTYERYISHGKDSNGNDSVSYGDWYKKDYNYAEYITSAPTDYTCKALSFSSAIAGIPQYAKGMFICGGGNDAGIIATDYNGKLYTLIRNNGTWNSAATVFSNATVLWTNSSPSSSFDVQKVYLDLTMYSFVAIVTNTTSIVGGSSSGMDILSTTIISK